MSVKVVKNLSNLEKFELSRFFDKFDTIYCDVDGVLFSPSLIPNANKIINKLLEDNKKVLTHTNNCVSTRADILKKFTQNNFNLTLDNIVTPNFTIAKYLKLKNFTKKVYVISSDETGVELSRENIQHIGIGRDDITESIGDYLEHHYELDEDVGAVIVGNDFYFSLPKMLKAINYLRNDDVLFFATNRDVNIELPQFVFPDCGALLASIEAASKRKATFIGKSSNIICDVFNIPVENRDKILMIGDRIHVDVLFGNEAGFETLLVETGDSKMKDVEEILRNIEGEKCEKCSKKEKLLIPDYVISSIGLFVD